MKSKYPYLVSCGLYDHLMYKLDNLDILSKIPKQELQMLIISTLNEYEDDFTILINDMINSVKQKVDKPHD